MEPPHGKSFTLLHAVVLLGVSEQVSVHEAESQNRCIFRYRDETFLKMVLTDYKGRPANITDGLCAGRSDGYMSLASAGDSKWRNPKSWNVPSGLHYEIFGVQKQWTQVVGAGSVVEIETPICRGIFIVFVGKQSANTNPIWIFHSM